jgi:hypothetical protein
MMGRAKHGATLPSQEDLSVQNNDGSNVFMLPGSKKNAKKLEKKEKQQQQHLQDKKKQSKGLQRKLRRLQEEKEKQEMRVQVIETLEYPFLCLCVLKESFLRILFVVSLFLSLFLCLVSF